LEAIPQKGYFWTIVTHPTTQQLTAGRVYTRDPALNELYIQYYKVVKEPIKSYCLKNTSRNLNAKGFSKYTSTTAISAIIKCNGCHLHDAQQLLNANQRAYRNNRSSPTCIFKQSAELAHLLPIKSHQLYQEIILLKHNLIDLLPLYECNTNLNFPSSQVLSSQGAVLPQVNIDRPAPSSSISNSCPSIDIVADLIDLLIEAQQVSNRLKIIASALRSVDNIQIYTDGSLQYDVSSMATMGFG